MIIDIKNYNHLAWNHSSLPPLLTAAPDPTGKSFLYKKNWNPFLRLSPNKKSVWEILKSLSPPSSLNKSRSQTWDHNPDRQTETRWCPPSERGSSKKSALFLSEMNLAGGFENPRRDVEHRAIAWDDNVCLERPIEPFVCTASRQQ